LAAADSPLYEDYRPWPQHVFEKHRGQIMQATLLLLGRTVIVLLAPLFVTTKPVLAQPFSSVSVSEVAQKTGKSAGSSNSASPIPASSHPASAHVVLTQEFQGFPAILVYEAALELTFPNGFTTTCANWDPTQLQPTPDSVGKHISGCEVRRGGSDGKRAFGFKHGDTIDVRFGNVDAVGNDFGGSSSTQIKRSELTMTHDGKIRVGRFRTTAVSAGGNGVNSTSADALSGRYALDGYTITITTDSGDTVHGFIAADVDPEKNEIGRIYLNGEMFSAK